VWSTTSAASRRAPSSGNERASPRLHPLREPSRYAAALILAWLAAACALPAAARPLAGPLPRPDAGDAAVLAELRAARRAAVREAALRKADGGAPFGLLVIPVDYADARFPTGFDAAQLALADGPDASGTLGHYVRVASRGRTALALAIAPVASLPGVRQDYSDLGFQGFERSRTMATLAIEAAVAAGVDLAAADADGDGEVDGILLLHAGPGLENDPAGWIVPQQYFLSEPVVARGILARSYAMASATSTLGVWAHETGHLLGLADRYDLGLPGSGETGPRGGLGRFSLMAAGWLGSGEGRDPALPDGYSRLELGWADPGAELAPGVVVRLRAAGPPDTEHFLAEWRSPAAVAPYDGALPASGAVVYHVDRSLADGEASGSQFPDRHLRVELVEADGGREVAFGESQGEPGDLFPSGVTSQRLADDTVPDSRTWGGEATGVDAVFALAAGGIRLLDQGPRPWADVRAQIETGGGGPAVRILARLDPDGPLPAGLPVTVSVANAEWGRFNVGETVQDVLAPETDPDTWENFRGQLWAWDPTPAVPPDAITRLTYHVDAGPDGGEGGGELRLVWNPAFADLGLEAWPGRWTVSHPGGDAASTWHRWPAAAATGLPPVPLLAATGADHLTGAGWPDVQYTNHGHARLLSAPLGAAVRWVELVHAVDLELLHQGRAIDGVGLAWVHDGGYTTAAIPADGWLGAVDSRAQHDLAGAPTFAVADPLDAQARPLWRREVLPLPDRAQHGPGPWRLRCELATSPVFRARGWLLQAPVASTGTPPATGFALTLADEALTIRWPATRPAAGFRVERSGDGGRTWQTATTVDATGGVMVVARSLLGLPRGATSHLRVVAEGDAPIVSRTLTATEAATAGLGPPRPNPAGAATTLAVAGGGDPRATLALYDLRGRLVRRWAVGGATAAVTWDGRDGAGRRVAAGVYIFRLRAGGTTAVQKLTWVP